MNAEFSKMNLPCNSQAKNNLDNYYDYDFEYDSPFHFENLTPTLKIENKNNRLIESSTLRNVDSPSETESENETREKQLHTENCLIETEPTSSKEKDPLAIDRSLKKADTWKFSTYPFICTVCNEWPFPGYDSLYFHMLYQHDRRDGSMYLKCIYCEKMILCYSAFLNHVRFSHNNDWKLICDICDERFDERVQLSQHRKKHRKSRDTKHPDIHLCFKCCRAYPNKPELCNHYNLSHSSKCKVCKKPFGLKIELEALLKKVQSPCVFCGGKKKKYANKKA